MFRLRLGLFIVDCGLKVVGVLDWFWLYVGFFCLCLVYCVSCLLVVGDLLFCRLFICWWIALCLRCFRCLFYVGFCCGVVGCVCDCFVVLL